MAPLGGGLRCPGDSPPKASQVTRRRPPALRRARAGRRQAIETGNDCLREAFDLDRERPHTMVGLRARLAARAGLHHSCLWPNRPLGRPTLAFADLVDW